MFDNLVSRRVKMNFESTNKEFYVQKGNLKKYRHKNAGVLKIFRFVYRKQQRFVCKNIEVFKFKKNYDYNYQFL